jgi:hypothetical protein
LAKGTALPAFADLGERFVGPAMGAFAAGNLQGAFNTFMQGVGRVSGARSSSGPWGAAAVAHVSLMVNWTQELKHACRRNSQCLQTIKRRARGDGHEPTCEYAGMNQQQRLALVGLLDRGAGDHRRCDRL